MYHAIMVSTIENRSSTPGKVGLLNVLFKSLFIAESKSEDKFDIGTNIYFARLNCHNCQQEITRRLLLVYYPGS